MVYTVTFNPSLDYIVSVENFRTGCVNRTSAEMVCAGGKGINVSLVLKNLGYESTALGFLAGFTGDEIARRLEKEGVKTDFIYIKDGMSRINIKIRAAQESEINGQGPAVSEEALQKLYWRLDRLAEGDALVLAGSIPESLPQSVYRDMMQYLEKKHLRIIVDAARDLLVNVLDCHPFLVKPNHHELGEIFGVQLSNKKEVIAYGRKLQEMGARNVLVSMAGDGAALLAEDGRVFEMEAPEGRVKNSVGAGDSMVAGFLAGYLESGDLETAFKKSVCAGSASAFSDRLATAEEVEKLLHTLPENG